MTKALKILSIDLGHNYGWCYKNGEDEESGYSNYKDIIEWGENFKKLIEKWKPEIIVLSQTNNFGYWNASRSMLIQAGIAFYIAGKKGISGIELNDSSARKEIFGKAIKKKEVQKLMPEYQADELDAIILARGWNQLNFNNL